MDYYYKAEEVRAQAKGKWLFILAALAPVLEEAIRRVGRHVDCPFHGGKRDFRLFKDSHESGGAVCTCGSWHDGIELLMAANGWSFTDCLARVGDYLNAPRHYRKKPATDAPAAKAKAKATAGTVHADTIATPEGAKPEASSNAGERRFRGSGVLIDHGAARYEFKEANELSYYVQIRAKNGFERTLWGVDLERALQAAQASKGDPITLYTLGRKPVTVMREKRDADGEILAAKPVSTHRTTWLVVNHTTVIEPDECLPATPPSVAHKQQAEAPEAPTWLLEAQARAEALSAQRSLAGQRAADRQNQLWNECLTLNSELAAPALLYLKNRKVLVRMDEIVRADSVRFHPNLPYYDENGNKLSEHPAIVCAVRAPDGSIVTLHRTYLSDKGTKAKVSEARKMMTIPEGKSVLGAAIPMGEPVNGVLGVAEGLETALAAYRATGIPTWSCVNATLLQNFHVPEGVHTVLIWADLDRSKTGEIAAAALKTRLESEGIICHVLLPKLSIAKNQKGVDWNDVIQTQGLLGFPPRRQLMTFIENNLQRKRLAAGYSPTDS